MAKIKLIPDNQSGNQSAPQQQSGNGRSIKKEFKRRRANTRIKHAFVGIWGRLMTFVGFLMIAGIAYGAYHVATHWDSVSLDYFIPIGSYTVLRKETVPGYVVAKELQEGQQRKDWSDWVDPRFIITCKSETTRQTIHFEVPESEYRDYSVGNEVKKGDTSLWTAMSKDSYEKAFHKPVKQEEPQEDENKIKIELPIINIPD